MTRCFCLCPQPVSSSDSEAPEADPAGGSEDDEDRGVMAVTAVTAAAASDRMESDSDSDKSSDNSGLKRKAVALKVGAQGLAHLACVGSGVGGFLLLIPPSSLLSLLGLSVFLFLKHAFFFFFLNQATKSHTMKFTLSKYTIW